MLQGLFILRFEFLLLPFTVLFTAIRAFLGILLILRVRLISPVQLHGRAPIIKSRLQISISELSQLLQELTDGVLLLRALRGCDGLEVHVFWFLVASKAAGTRVHQGLHRQPQVLLHRESHRLVVGCTFSLQ